MAHNNLVDGTSYATQGGRCLVDGTVYGIQKGKTMVDGTVLEILFEEKGVHLSVNKWDNRNGAVLSADVTDTKLSSSVSGGSGTSYSGVDWELRDGKEMYMLNVGDIVRFSFTGTKYTGDYATYGLAFFTDPDSAWNSYVATYFNSNQTNVTYRVTTKCYCTFFTQVGGADRSDIYATLNITRFQINGETIWAK